MADGFDVHLENAQAAHLLAMAKEKGIDPERYARMLLEDAFERDNPGWIVRTRLAEYDRTGESVPAKEAFAKFRADVEARLAVRSK